MVLIGIITYTLNSRTKEEKKNDLLKVFGNKGAPVPPSLREYRAIIILEYLLHTVEKLAQLLQQEPDCQGDNGHKYIVQDFWILSVDLYTGSDHDKQVVDTLNGEPGEPQQIADGIPTS